MEMSPGEGSVLGGVIGAMVGWFGNLIYMRDKFVSAKQCETCKSTTVATETIQINALGGRMTAVEECVGDLFKQSKENHGMIREIHGILKGKRLDVL